MTEKGHQPDTELLRPAGSKPVFCLISRRMAKNDCRKGEGKDLKESRKGPEDGKMLNEGHLQERDQKLRSREADEYLG